MEIKTSWVECLIQCVMPSGECKNPLGSIPWNQNFGFFFSPLFCCWRHQLMWQHTYENNSQLRDTCCLEAEKIQRDTKGFPIWRLQRAFLWRTELTLPSTRSRALQLWATFAKVCVDLNVCSCGPAGHYIDPVEINVCSFRQLPCVNVGMSEQLAPTVGEIMH